MCAIPLPPAFQAGRALTTPQGWAKHVSANAVRLAMMNTGRTVAAPLIDLARHGLQVFRIHAATITTQMVNLCALRNRTVGEFVSYAMGMIRTLPMSTFTYAPITSRKQRRHPWPARIGSTGPINLGPEPFLNRSGFSPRVTAITACTLTSAERRHLRQELTRKLASALRALTCRHRNVTNEHNTIWQR